MDKLMFLYKNNIKKVLMVDLLEDYMSMFEQQFELFFGRQKFNPYDKTAPSYIKSDILSYVRTSLTNAIEAIDTKGDMRLTGIDLDVFSLPGEKDTSSLKLFYFYLYGTTGDYVSISQEIYKEIFGSGSGSVKLGRFGTMFMMTMSAYKKLYSKGGGSKKGWPSPMSIKHPFSGAPPVRLFEIVWDKIESGFDKYTKKAMDITTKS